MQECRMSNEELIRCCTMKKVSTFLTSLERTSKFVIQVHNMLSRALIKDLNAETVEEYAQSTAENFNRTPLLILSVNSSLNSAVNPWFTYASSYKMQH